MVYVFSHQSVNTALENVKIIHLNSEYPLRQIFSCLCEMSPSDLVMLVAKDLIPTDNYLSKTIPIYKDHYNVLSLSVDDPEKEIILVEENRFKPTDTVIFKKGTLRSGLTDFSGYSTYDFIREKIIRLCGGGVYAPIDRSSQYKEFSVTTPVQEVRSQNIVSDYNNDIKQPLLHQFEEESGIYKVKINMGLGDMIYTRGILDAQKHKIKEVHISANMRSYYEARQPKKADLEFTQKLFDHLFKRPYYITCPPDKPFPERSAFLYYLYDKFPLIKPELADELCEGKPLNIGPYILISTRARGITKNEYDNLIRVKFMDALKRLSTKYKVVIMGERNFINYQEQTTLVNMNMMLVIYKDVVNSVPKEQLVDLTFDNMDSIKEDRYSKFRQECLYMRNAAWNITLGIGGPFCMATSLGNVIGYCSPNMPNDSVSLIFNEKRYPGIRITTEIDTFFNELNKIVKAKNVLKAKINLGLGDIIYTKALLDRTHDNYNKIYLSPNKTILNTYRDGDIVFYNFCKNFMKLIFDNSIYTITDDQSYPQMMPHQYKEYKTEPIKPSLVTYLCDSQYVLPNGLLEDNYIVITTKVRALDISLYEQLVKSGFWNNVKLLSNKYKLVVIGEREIGENKEYKNISRSVYSVYDDIVKHIGKDNIIDLTIPELGKTSPSIDNIKVDCSIMNKASYVITIGIGGNFVLSTSVAKNTICYGEKVGSVIVENLYETNKDKNPTVFLSNNIDDVNNKIIEVSGITKKEYKACLYLGIGTLIYIKAMLDNVKHEYDKIYLSPRKDLLKWIHPDRKDWADFKDDLLKLFFSEQPYVLTDDQSYPKKDISHFGEDGLSYVTPDLKEYLCKGTLPKKLENKQFVVMSTKVRWFYKDFYKKAIDAGLWTSLSKLSEKYKFVILGERVVERNAEYKQAHIKDHVYSLYDDIIENIPKKNVIDLTIPAYGLSEPSLPRLQNDCYIMSKAKYSITLGIGGNFCMSTAVATTIGLDDPKDPDITTKKLYLNNSTNDRVWVTQDIKTFIDRIKEIS